MIIYCNGDSFVAGSELADDILPEYPGNFSINDSQEQRKRGNQWLARTYPGGDLYELRQLHWNQISILEKQRAFPNKLQNKLQCVVLNSALNGSSFDRIARTSILDLLTLKNKHSDETIIAIIGQTDPARFEVAGYDMNLWQCILARSHSNPEVNNILNYKIKYETDYHQYVKYYLQMILLQDFCKNNNIKLHWIDTSGQDQTILSKIMEIPDIKKLQNYITTTSILTMGEVAYSCNLQNTLCPGGHFAEPVHEIIADTIVSYLMRDQG